MKNGNHSQVIKYYKKMEYKSFLNHKKIYFLFRRMKKWNFTNFTFLLFEFEANLEGFREEWKFNIGIEMSKNCESKNDIKIFVTFEYLIFIIDRLFPMENVETRSKSKLLFQQFLQKKSKFPATSDFALASLFPVLRAS